jgi:cbb3-type cytochrome oxidase maturation protein
MGVIVLLIGCGVLLAGGFLIAFLHATGNGQYDDLHTPAIRMLFDDRESAAPELTQQPSTERSPARSLNHDR